MLVWPGLVSTGRDRYPSHMVEGENESATRRCEVAVVGAGAVGLTLALGLAQAGVRTELIGPRGTDRPGRTVALLEGSVRLLDRLGLWPELAGHSAALKSMRIVDATNSLFRPAPVQFDAAELGRAAFGYNVVSDVLEHVLLRAAAATPNLGLVPGKMQQVRFGPDCAVLTVEEHGAVRAGLVVAADGRQSLARKCARIGARVRQWPQTALTALFRHEAPHGNTSVEFHTRQGPFTLVPLVPTAEAPFRSSLVWVMGPEEARDRRAVPEHFAALVESQAGRLFGSMQLDSPIGSFPIVTSSSARLVAPRLALAGEAAHALPPIGAQGLNLSLRDVDTLIGLLGDAKRRGEDLGSPAVLARYDALRRGDVTTRRFGVDLLNGSLLQPSVLGDFVRGAGLASLAAAGPLRRLVMRQGLVPPSLKGGLLSRLDGRDGIRPSTAALPEP